jgi:hypothetical protein
MPRPSSTLWAAVIVTIVALLGSAAVAANIGDLGGPAAISASVNADLSGTTFASLHQTEQANEPADETVGASHEEANENENAKDNENEPEDQTKSAGGPKDETSGARPGFGCGDTNHEHSGPPGRPNASPPPGCAKASEHDTDTDNASHATVPTTVTTTNTTAHHDSGDRGGGQGRGRGSGRD